MPPTPDARRRHELTTEERQRGAYAAAAAKREKKRRVDEEATRLRAERKVYRREHWYSGWNATTRAAEREGKPLPLPAVWFDEDGQRHTNFACEHGAYDCSFCNGRHEPRHLG